MKNYKYDIFISYKHESLDKTVAAKLQKSLEHYKIPKEIQKKTGKEKIKRVFRDEEELAVSSDLGKEIEGQIAQSEYLLVVCSKKTKESQWVLKEIDTFLKYRDAEHILPVLIEGEPEESFPESILAYGEPMAADVRGKNEKEVLKKVKKELPRLIAPILHCSYDELKQRARNYQIKRMLIGTSVALVAVASFAAYAVFQSARLNKEYQETRRNQARNMAQTSEKLLEQGDRIGALKTALAVQTENPNSKEALVPEQMKALNDALYSYVTGNLLDFHPIRAEYTEDKLAGKIEWNQSKEYYMALGSLGYIYFFEGKTGKCIWKEFGGNLDEKVKGFFSATFIDDSTAALLAEKKIFIVNFKKKVAEQTIELGINVKESLGMSDILRKNNGMIIKKDRIFIYGTEGIAAYNLNTEKQLFKIKKNELKKGKDSEINKVLYSGKYNMLIISKMGLPESGGGLFTYSITNKEIKQISKKITYEVSILNDKYIAAFQSKKDAGREHGIYIYDYHNGQNVWSRESIASKARLDEYEGSISTRMQVNQKMQDVAIFYFRDMIYCMLLNNFEIIDEKQYDAYIIGIEQYDDRRILIGTEDGSIFLYFQETHENPGARYAKVGKIESKERNGLTQFSYSKNIDVVVQGNREDKMIVTSGNLKDTKVSKVSVRNRISSIKDFSVREEEKEKTYRCIWYERREYQFGVDGMKIYEVGKPEILYQREYSDNLYLDN